jgi:PIN domain nuclease of toxin-antitoxin system
MHTKFDICVFIISVFKIKIKINLDKIQGKVICLSWSKFVQILKRKTIYRIYLLSIDYKVI